MARVSGYAYGSFGEIIHGVESVALSDSVIYLDVQGFMVNADGTLAVQMADGSAATLTVKAGVTYPFAVRKVKSTGSTGVTTVVLLY